MRVGGGYPELAALLQREREVLDRLVVGYVSGDAEDTALPLFDALRSLELHRAITAREVAAELGHRGEATLAELAEQAPADWRPELQAHRAALMAQAEELAGLMSATVVDVWPDEGSTQVQPGVQRSLRDFLG